MPAARTNTLMPARLSLCSQSKVACRRCNVHLLAGTPTASVSVSAAASAGADTVGQERSRSLSSSLRSKTPAYRSTVAVRQQPDQALVLIVVQPLIDAIGIAPDQQTLGSHPMRGAA